MNRAWSLTLSPSSPGGPWGPAGPGRPTGPWTPSRPAGPWGPFSPWSRTKFVGLVYRNSAHQQRKCQLEKYLQVLPSHQQDPVDPEDQVYRTGQLDQLNQQDLSHQENPVQTKSERWKGLFILKGEDTNGSKNLHTQTIYGRLLRKQQELHTLTGGF